MIGRCLIVSCLLALASAVAVSKGVGACDGKPCLNGGFCVAVANDTFRCYCPVGWTGPTCAKVEGPCDGSPCKNGGTCTPDEDFFYTCACETGWKGNQCDEQRLGKAALNCVQYTSSSTDPCALGPCPADAWCLDHDRGFICLCFPDDGVVPSICDLTVPLAPEPPADTAADPDAADPDVDVDVDVDVDDDTKG